MISNVDTRFQKFLDILTSLVEATHEVVTFFSMSTEMNKFLNTWSKRLFEECLLAFLELDVSRCCS